jgi:membrane-bound lytic murein transglycosylase MltF
LVLAGCGGEGPREEIEPGAVGDTVETPRPSDTLQEGSELGSAPTLADDPALISQEIPGLEQLQEPWFGDLDGMVERRIIRAAVVHSKTLFFLDGARPRGLTFEALTRFEEVLNEELETGHLKVHVVLIPMTRDQLFPALLEGRVDVAAANLTITPERLETVDFGDPLLRNVSEVVVTGPGTPGPESLEDLSGMDIHVRPSSSFYQSLLQVNEGLRRDSLDPIRIQEADELLESEDLLELVNAGLLPATVVDNHMADFWGQIFPGIQVHGDLPIKEGGGVAWAIRKDSPQLKAELDEFAAEHRQGTLLGNITLRRYLSDIEYVANPTEGEAQRRFNRALPVFQEYAGEYGFDPLLVLALGYQESGLDQSAESHVGAQGIMQLMPSTAADPNVGIPDVSTMENNVHAGTKYLRFLLDQYFSNEPLDELNEHFFAFASYNAGPGRVARLRAEASELGLDPNVWFRNVEHVAARRIGRETVQYVSNIYKYYLTYSRIEELERR